MYLILDEFICSGEIQETAKKVGLMVDMVTAVSSARVEPQAIPMLTWRCDHPRPQVILERLAELDKIDT